MKVNGHIHTPYSFSAFNSIEEAVELAEKENIQILGINDFYTAEGYDEFNNACVNKKIYPLFNIEFMGLSKEHQEKGIRFNDPNNPGRIYFSGKGLNYPFKASKSSQDKLNSLVSESNKQTMQMIEKANAYFISQNIPLQLDFEDIKTKYAKSLVRERHIAKAIRIQISENFKEANKRSEILQKLYDGKETQVDVNDNSALENEIRGRLLKSGGPAFVSEDENAFLSLEEIIELILDAGGIPCYPVLLDDPKGNITEFEADMNKLHTELTRLSVGCIELIPGRNDLKIMEKFVKFFNDKNYTVLFGTEHNTPDLAPLTVSCRNEEPLTEELLKISFESSCVVVAHQHMMREDNKEVYFNRDGKVNFAIKADYVKMGKTILDEFLSK